MKILVCDDEPSVTEYVVIVLRSEGHEVEASFDGLEALEKIQADPGLYDVLITDNRMPRMSGIELIKELRALKLPLKIIMITGFVVQLETAPGDQQLFDRLLLKPFRAAELLNCFNELVC